MDPRSPSCSLLVHHLERPTPPTALSNPLLSSLVLLVGLPGSAAVGGLIFQVDRFEDITPEPESVAELGSPFFTAVRPVRRALTVSSDGGVVSDDRVVSPDDRPGGTSRQARRQGR